MTIIREAANLSHSGNRWRARLIEAPIHGSSGYYSAETVRRDGPTAFPASTPIYFDHPSRSEEDDRPERSVRDLAGKLISTPVFENDGLYADVEFYSWAADIVREMGPDIGMSIRASAEVVPGVVDGRQTRIVSRLIEGASVDLVTRAGAGGKLVSLLESARPDPEAARGQIDEASTSDRRDQLQRAIRATVKGWAYLVDFDETRLLAWYESDGDDGRSRTWEQGFMPALDDMSVTLTGTPVEVRPVTTFHPVGQTGSIGESSPATTTKEKHMEITEAKFAELTATADRVTALEADLAAEKQRAEAAEAEARKVTHDAYTVQVAAALEASTLPTAARQRVAAALALAEGADVPADSAAVIESAIKTEADYLASVAPAPRKGLGFGAATSTTSESYTNAWGRTITKEA